MSKEARLALVCVVMVAALFCALPALAADEGQMTDNAWRHSVNSTFWLMGMYGDQTIKGKSVHVEKDLSDAWDKLSDLDIAAILRYEVSKGRIGGFADVSYIRLEYNGDTSLGPTELKPSTLLAELGGMYTVWGSKLEQGIQDVAAYAGARYTRLDATLKADAAGVDKSGDKNWTDGFVGARYRRDLLPWWRISLRGDVGAGGSEFTWNALGAFEFRTTKLTTLSVGWRTLYQDYSTGSGDSKFVYDMRQSGPFLFTRITF